MATRVEQVTPAEAIAASMCWLARFRYGEEGAAIEKGVNFWHRKACRFCSLPASELLTTYSLERVDQADLKAFQRLDRKARAARVYEAQEEPWWLREG